MALVLSDIATVLRKMMPEAKSAGVQEIARALKAHFVTLGLPDLKIVFFSGLETADAVVSDSACKLYAVYVKKPAASTTNAWFKGSNHATVAAANGDITVFLVGTSGGGRSYLIPYADGLPLSTGLTLGSHTTVNGNTKSAVADAPTGFAIVGAA